MNTTTSVNKLTIEAKKALLQKMLKARITKAQQTFPMSKGQESLWYVHQTAPLTSAYNIASTVTIYNAIDLTLLEKAINSCIKRHPALSTSYSLEHEKNIQRIQTDIKIKIKKSHVETLSDIDLKSQIEYDYSQPFDLTQAPIIRANVYQKSTDEVVFMLVIHHIGFDASSLWILMEELGEIYQALQQDRPSALNAPADSYRDFTAHQIQLLTSKKGDKTKNYWLDKLSGDLPPLTLNIAKPRLAVQSYQGKTHYFEISKQLSTTINSLAKHEGVTAYTVMLSAYYLLLHRHSAQDDICILSPTVGRNQPQFMRTVGYFVNPVVMRTNLANNPTFTDLLANVNETVLEGLAHQDYPFSSLIEALNPKRDASYSPLSQTSFVFQKTASNDEFSHVWQPGKEGNKVSWAGLEIAQYPLNQQEGQFELELEVIDNGTSFFGVFKYNDALFDAKNIEMLTAHLQALLSEIVTTPSKKINQYSILTPVEAELIKQWNNTDVTYPDVESLHQLFEQQVVSAPDNIALTFENESLTYHQLNKRANQLAHFLIVQGVTVETKVAICMNRSIEMVVSLLAIIKAGGAYVPVDPNYPEQRVAFLIKDANSPLLLTQENLINQLPVIETNMIAVDLLLLGDMLDTNPNVTINANNLAYMIYTSGSTGNPKGTMNNHAGICNRLQWMQAQYKLDSSDTVLQKTPFSFDVSVWEFFWPLMTGARLVVARPEGHKDTNYLVDLIITEKVTTLHFVPSMLSLFLTHELAQSCSSLKRVICSGEALNYELQQRFFDQFTQTELHNLYGPTEAAIDVTYWQCTNDYSANIVPIGKPIANIKIHILDDNMQPVPIGVNGELHIGGIGVARGYHNRTDLTDAKFISDPFSLSPNAKLYKTGDLVRYLADGNIEYLQRIDNQIKLRGFRIELGEVEALICRCDAIKESVVLKRTNTTGDDYLVAYVTCDDNTLTESDVLTRAAKVLPAHCLPSAVILLDNMPLTPNGKTDHKQLPKHSFEQEDIYIIPPRTPLERNLLTLWRELLNIENISINDNFFALGGHSLLAVKLMASIESQFNEKLPLSSLIQSPTIEKLAQHINKGAQDNWKSLVAIQAKGTKKPLFFVPGGGGNILYFYALAEQLGNEQPFFALQAQGLDGVTDPLTSLQEIAAKAIAEIKEVQPEGPYILGGHCVGGLIAFEISQQLRTHGDTIEKLIILDAPAAHFFKQKEVLLTHEQWISVFISTIEQMLDKTLTIEQKLLEQSDREQQLNLVKQKLAQVGVVPENTPTSQINGLLEVFKSNASLFYPPDSVHQKVPVALLRAQTQNAHYDYSCHDDEKSTLTTSSLGWNTYGSAETHLVDGDHITMLAPQHAEQLASVITKILTNKGNSSC